jgi:hypothetical protein
LTFSYEFEGNGDLLMMSLPHHQDILDSSVQRPDLMMDSLKGQMVGVVLMYRKLSLPIIDNFAIFGVIELSVFVIDNSR